jgi:hypothetical protein
MKYLKIWSDFREIIEPLTDAEKGRLFDAMLLYAETGEEPGEFVGNERFLWNVAKRDIDRTAERSEAMRRNGSLGGRPESGDNQTEANESNENQTKANESNENQSEANESLKEKKRKEKKGNEIKRKEISSSLSDDDAAALQTEHNRVLDAAEDAGFKMSNNVRAALINLYSRYGLERVLTGLQSCSRHGVPTLAYLEACMTDRPKQAAQPVRQVPAQQYGQRSYSAVQDEIIERQEREIMEKLKAKGAAAG